MLPCILCDTPCGESSSPGVKLKKEAVHASDFIKAHKNYYTFCKHLDITTAAEHGKHSEVKFNFTRDNLPFCSNCLTSVESLVHLDDELDRIHGEIQLLVQSFRLKVKNLQNSPTNQTKKLQRSKTTTTTTTTTTSTDPRITNVRNLILGVTPDSRSSDIHCDSGDEVVDDFDPNDVDYEDEDSEVDATKKNLKSKKSVKVSCIKSTNSVNARQTCIMKASSTSASITATTPTKSASKGEQKVHGSNSQSDDVIYIENDGGDGDVPLDVGETVTIPMEDNSEGVVVSNKIRKKIFRPRNKMKKVKTKTQPRRVVNKTSDGRFIFEGVEFYKNDNGNYQCCTCPNILKTRDSVLVHIKQRHLGEGLGSFLCHVCGKNFDRLVYLKTHEVLHTDVKRHTCPTCGRAFAQRTNLYNHMKIHDESNKDKICEICGRRFITRGQMRLHMKMHLGIRPHQCPDCSKTFVRSYDLVLHRRIHTGERPHHCNLCPSKFYTKYRLNRHLTNVHRPDKTKGSKSKQLGKQEESEQQEHQQQIHSIPIQMHIQAEPITFYELL